MGDTFIGVGVLLVAFIAANINRMPAGFQGFLELRLTVRNLLLVLGFGLVWRLGCVLVGLYDEARVASQRGDTARVLVAVTAGSGFALVFPLISVTKAFSPLAIVYFWLGTSLAMLLLRAGLRSILAVASARTRNVLIVGSGPRGQSLHKQLRDAEGYQFLGFVDSDHRDLTPAAQASLVGSLETLEEILMRQPVDEVLIALPARSQYADIQRTIEICERGGVHAKYLADIFQHRRMSETNGGSLALVPIGIAPDDPRFMTKRVVDLVLGSIALVASAPLLVVAALAIKLTSSGPIIFAQERYGLNKRRFRMYKLRTMVVGAEAMQVTLEDRNEASGPVFKIRADPRVTPVGGVLRRLSIDELPQLVNVLRGDMSLVGPRPLPMRDVSRFTDPALMRRFSVHPGVTGLWQVSGRSELTFDDWIRLDLQYIDGWSFDLDLRILLRTLPAVLRGTGAA